MTGPSPGLGAALLGCGPAPLLGGLCLGLSVLAFAAYGRDKWAARRGRRRTPEAHLHLIGLAGGWPGAWLAQRVWHHKHRKPAFVRLYRATVLGHLLACAVVLWLLPPGRGCVAGLF